MTFLRFAARVLPTGLSLLGLGACAQILGVGGIPGDSPDSGADATTHAEAGRDAGADARDARADRSNDVGSSDAPRPAVCEAGTTRCTADGRGFETCGATGWVQTSCDESTPICVAGACACEPGATRCARPDYQVFERCVTDGGTPHWPDAGVACPGTCTLTGCGALPPSCAGLPDAGTRGVANCTNGIDGGGESCCASNEVSGGETFFLSYDGLSGGYTSPSNAAVVSGFRLDRFEVTVGRFRSFVADVRRGWVPRQGAGKHTHLNGGQGLVDRALSGDGSIVFEPGWNSRWSGALAPSVAEAALDACSLHGYGDWSLDPGSADDFPMNCLTWVQAYAFCIWDGGFLPSEAEWNYAAAGGSDQRVYPWSPSFAAQKARIKADAGADKTIGCAEANYLPGSASCGDMATVNPRTVGGPSVGAGDSRWRQADMAGNVVEWTLDARNSYAGSCADCTYLGAATDAAAPVRSQRGGSFFSVAYDVLASYRGYDSQNSGAYTAGVRCARVP